MDKKSRVFVFDRIELALLICFFIAVSISAFVLGIRLGKDKALNQVGIIQEDVREVELKSEKEEYVEKIIDDTEELPADVEQPSNDDIDEEAFSKLQEEFDKLDRQEFKPEAKEALDETKDLNLNESQANLNNASKDILGKYTIQLGSHKSVEEAKNFAEGFLARGYKPLINEVDVPGKGNWYRVSIGAFQSKDAAKAYIKSEQSLFNGYSYVITIIK